MYEDGIADRARKPKKEEDSSVEFIVKSLIMVAIIVLGCEIIKDVNDGNEPEKRSGDTTEQEYRQGRDTVYESTFYPYRQQSPNKTDGTGVYKERSYRTR